MEPALAGMPSYSLTEIASLRLSAISFFLLVYLLASFGVQQLWNLLRRDFPALPRLAYPRALLLVFILGLSFHLVLVMIAGTRELMTPTAWERAGLVHKVAPDGFETLMAARRHRLARLREALWIYAGDHGQRFPGSEEASGLDPDLWLAPDGESRYRYFPPEDTGGELTPLVVEPARYGAERLVLFRNGAVALLPEQAIAGLAGGTAP